jgi:replicative DNA helicase
MMVTNVTNQPVLYSREAEEALLGSVLVSPDIYPILAGQVKARDFYIMRHQWIWEAYATIQDAKSAIDFVTLTAHLEANTRLEDVGGPAYITALLNQVPSYLNAEHYAEIVSDFSERRRILNFCNDTATKLFSGDLSAGEIVAQAEQQLRGTARPAGGMISLEDALSEHYDLTKAVSSGEVQPKIVPTGIYEIDKLMAGGMRGGDLVLLGGRPGQGKSSTLLTIADHNLEMGKSVLIFSPEMSHEQITSRLLIFHANVDPDALRQNKLIDGQFTHYTAAIEKLNKYHLFMNDQQNISPQQMRARCLEVQSRHGVDLVIVDYLQLMISERARENRVQEVSYLSRSLKMLARELNVPVMAASQLSRAVEGREEKRPKLSDLRESGSLEADADMVLFVWNPDDYAKGDMLPCGLTLAKQRNGPVGDAQVLFNKKKARLENRTNNIQ